MTTETSGTLPAVGDMTGALARVAETMHLNMLIAFDLSGRADPWAPLKYRKGKPLILTGALRGSGETTSGPDFAQVTAGRGMMHAAIHQYGGTTHPRVTAKSKAFFWAKWYETGETKWKAMALGFKVGEKMTIRIPARPFLVWAPGDVEQYQQTLMGAMITAEPVTAGKVAA